MPNPFLIPAIIGGVSSLVNAVGGSQSQRSANEKNMEIARYQNQWNLDQWHRENAYNSPQAQMQRFKNAGLNPNMIYGQGTPGNAMSGKPAQGATMVPTFRPAEGIGQMLGMYQQFKVQQAQIDKLHADTQLTNSKTLTEEFNRTLKDIQGKSIDWNIQRSQGLFPHDVRYRRAQGERMDQSIQLDFQRLLNMRQDEVLKKLVEDEKRKNLSLMDLEGEKRRAELVFQKYKNAWAKEGITTSDNPVLRMIVRAMHEAGLDFLTGEAVDGPKDVIDKTREHWKKIFNWDNWLGKRQQEWFGVD